MQMHIIFFYYFHKAWKYSKKVDNIIAKLTSGEIDRSTAKTKIMKVDNLELVGIDEYNVDEVIYEAHANA